MNTAGLLIAAIGLALLFVTTVQGLPVTDEDLVGGARGVPSNAGETVRNRASRYPIVIPTTAELRKMLRNRKPVRRKATPERRVIMPARAVPLGNLSRSDLVGPPRCNRAVPTRAEFLRMLRERPADARQIMERCKIDVSTLSPIRQLPVGGRQLPVDTRQRPVGTWRR